MVTKIEEIYRDIDTLPEEAQSLLLDFIQLLKKRYQQTENQHIENEKTFSSTQKPKPHPLDTFIETHGVWEDERTAEEIVKEIYDSRTISNYDISL
ncbi:DUF2281 domain-containing protein [Nodularia spumigena CS-584]|jgi:hypothetical protein|uniref:Uncharacterized protein n=2 Tax=Nodularia spumigena TaxID=70799 RepID=A0A2S0PYZ3_NODSP|nr:MULTISPECIES: DUF2281 domain-containing protein [Cyanophyceae]MDB9356077.1 DUF2281 domain-containing protein [Nodularia spumigena CS-587/03]AHJ27018.1 hypothetical protein NSP_6700 [Nodularia spumigena CCY9414]AVZ29646.1 hypothetical protein BMF81_00402 [Nodularia spumigena UHCC 0039]EAW42556.1 hypothetical protein N9414_24288 [Nodularia spumigena CCY9414]MDB9324284.1 DUF2281 domain-containing protein [Nodularia spumigena CS-591/07A]